MPGGRNSGAVYNMYKVNVHQLYLPSSNAKVVRVCLPLTLTPIAAASVCSQREGRGKSSLPSSSFLATPFHAASSICAFEKHKTQTDQVIIVMLAPTVLPDTRKFKFLFFNTKHTFERITDLSIFEVNSVRSFAFHLANIDPKSLTTTVELSRAAFSFFLFATATVRLQRPRKPEPQQQLQQYIAQYNNPLASDSSTQVYSTPLLFTTGSRFLQRLPYKVLHLQITVACAS